MLIVRLDPLVSDIHVPPVSVRVGPVVLSCLLGAQDGDGEMSIAEFVPTSLYMSSIMAEHRLNISRQPAEPDLQ